MPFVNERPGTKPSDGWRTVDHERDAILRLLSGLPHGGGAWFHLIWLGEEVHFGAYERLNGYIDSEDKSKGLRKVFTIFQMKVPESLESQKETILKLVTEALSEYRELYQHCNIVEVHTDFSQCRYYKS
jgi:hypothetical protein